MYAQEIQDACLCLWLAETILTLSLQRNSASKISTSSIMFLYFSLIIYQNLILPFQIEVLRCTIVALWAFCFMLIYFFGSILPKRLNIDYIWSYLNTWGWLWLWMSSKYPSIHPLMSNIWPNNLTSGWELQREPATISKSSGRVLASRLLRIWDTYNCKIGNRINYI